MKTRIASSSPWLAAAAVLAATGLIQGRIEGRWASSARLETAVRRLERLPATLGTWHGTAGDADLPTLHRIGIDGGVLRKFRDDVSGEQVTALLVCGRPGPVAVHTPDVCYRGAGYEVATPASGSIPGFATATMIRPGPTVDRLQVFWTWNGGRRWEIPGNPRLTFGGNPFLYKLYVVRPMTATSPPRSEAVEAFCRELAAHLQTRLGDANP